MSRATLGVIVGNRDIFPDHLVTEARRDAAALFDKMDLGMVILDESATKLGGVESFAEAQACAALFRAHGDEIAGILVILPNFGDEKGVADTVRLAGLDVPILVQGYPDDLDKLVPATRRDAFCGKISVCNNLVQRGIPFSLTRHHVVRPDHDSFQRDLEHFVAVCRVVNGVRTVRLGAVGARPGAFNTVRYSEKILERHGITVTTVDLSEVLGEAAKLGDGDAPVQAKIDAVQAYAATGAVPDDKMLQIAKLGVVLDEWMGANEIDATAIQCWPSMQTNYGCNVCTNMSMMSEGMMPSACEVDVTGTLTMYAMQLASSSPSALVDWNNNYGDDENKCVLFHCGNWARSFLPDIAVGTAPILGSVLGEGNTYGALEGRTAAGPLTFGRLTTDDAAGTIRAYIGQGALTDDPLATFGSRAVAHVPDLQRLMRHVCGHGFEHHVVMNASHTADVLHEAFDTYLGWDVYYHGGPRA